MSKSGNLWAVGFDEAGRAAQVRDELTRLSREEHCLILEDAAVAVRYPDGPLILDGEPFLEMTEVPVRTVASFLAVLALGAPPTTGAAVGGLLNSFGFNHAAVGISDDFVREVAHLIQPGSSVLFVLDDARDMDAILHAIRGLGGTVLKTSVDFERLQLIQSTLAARNE
jgi:uncharacterized membrane protein